jgi:seryl-tRNA synthetase
MKSFPEGYSVGAAFFPEGYSERTAFISDLDDVIQAEQELVKLEKAVAEFQRSLAELRKKVNEKKIGTGKERVRKERKWSSIEFRVSDQEKEKLNNYAKENGQTMSELIRSRIPELVRPA